AADKPARISIPVQWGRYRLEVSTSDRNGPMTSLGFDAGWYAETSADTPDMLEIALDKPEYVPGESMTVAVTARAPGEVTRIVIAAVDVGILNLTNYKPPAPDDYYLGQRRLTAEIRDLYGQLIDGMQGARGQIRTGGDAGAELQGSPPTQKPLALYSGIVAVK